MRSTDEQAVRPSVAAASADGYRSENCVAKKNVNPHTTQGIAPHGVKRHAPDPDEQSLRTLTRTLLEQQGHSVLEANNGRHAIEVAQGHGGPIHLLLTDVVMPGMNGPALAAQLAHERPAIRVVYMSGYAGFTGRDLFDSEAAILTKPFTRDALLRKAQDVSERGKAIRGKVERIRKLRS